MIVGINNLEVSKWLIVVLYFYMEQDVLYFMNMVIFDFDGVYYVIDVGNGLIGVIGIDLILGYWLYQDVQGYGYMIEVVVVVIVDYFVGLFMVLGLGYFLGNIVL